MRDGKDARVEDRALGRALLEANSELHRPFTNWAGKKNTYMVEDSISTATQ